MSRLDVSGEMNGKVVVITGGSMGIGEALAGIFLRHSATLVLSSRSLPRVEVTRQRLASPERTLAIACDVRDPAAVARLVETTLSQCGKIDVWINNAGFGLIDSIADMKPPDYRAMFETNLFGAIHCMQAVAPVMRLQNQGTIINISSIAGHIPVPYMGAYCATKHALNAISKAMRMELAKTRVHVMTVCPGYIRTDFAVNAVKGSGAMRLGFASRRGISADRVAQAVLRGYQERKREIVVPWSDRIIIKGYQLLPRLMEAVMLRALRPAEQVIAEAEAARTVKKT